VLGLGHVRPNWFYDAAVRSMGRSWHNFFFAAFDPAGRVAVDKPPLELWMQVASVKLLGWGQVSLKLPEALAGAAGVPLLYDTLRRLVGRTAGLAGAAALAVLPVAVLTARSVTMDTTATTLALLAAWLTVLAVQRERPALLTLAGVAIGLAFNVKLVEALLPVPGIALLYALGCKAPWRRRALHLAAAGTVLVAVSVSWLVATSFVAGGGKPYPMGSRDGTTWSAAFYHDAAARSGSLAGGHGTLPGAARMLGKPYGPDVGVELVAAALLGALALASVAQRRGWPARARDASSLAFPGVLAFAAWLLADLAVLARMPAADPRYLAIVAPPLAGCLGIATAELLRRKSLAWRIALAGALAAVALYAGHQAPDRSLARTVALGAAALVALSAPVVRALAARRGRGVEAGHRLAAGAALALASIAILAVPLAVSLRVVHAGQSDASRLPSLPGGQRAAFLRYASAHAGREPVAVWNPTAVAQIIAQSGTPILPLTSWSQRPVVRLRELRAKASEGEVRLALLGNPRCDVAPPAHPPHCLPTVRWIAAHGRDVTRAAAMHAPYALYALGPKAARSRGRLLAVSPRRRPIRRLHVGSRSGLPRS
jgi:4-amino-4-deoxy-L-arabinose transferase-like glycosyltransferase